MFRLGTTPRIISSLGFRGWWKQAGLVDIILSESCHIFVDNLIVL